jgi:hypothetical protein
MTEPSQAGVRPVSVLLEELANGERIPMGLPDDDGDTTLERYDAFAFVDREGTSGQNECGPVSRRAVTETRQ